MPMTWPELLQQTWWKLAETLAYLGPYLAAALPLVAWCAWWLGAVNWRKCWPALARGAWVPVLLLAVVAAMVWTKVQAADCHCLGSLTIPNGWWQAGAVAALAAVALFCGWLQEYFGWMPPEIPVEPAPHAHGHGHGRGHH
jgi:hypothetical protein